MPDSHQLPQTTAMDRVTLDSVQHAALRSGLDYWNRLRGARPWPSRAELNLRDMAGFVRHMVLLRVIDNGADFEHRIVGDAMANAFSVPIQYRRFSEIARDVPVLAEKAMLSSRSVLQSRAPVALRERIGSAELCLVNAEMVLLPLGPVPDCIDHILCFGFHGARISSGKPRPGAKA